MDTVQAILISQLPMIFLGALLLYEFYRIRRAVEHLTDTKKKF